MKTFYLFSTLLLCALTSSVASEWKDLFNGKNLKGWETHGGEATFKVKDEAIWGFNGPGHNTFLCTKQTYSDFELEFEVLLPNAMNSGVQIRSKVKEGERKGKQVELVYGPQIEIEQGPAEAGYIYGEQAGGWMTPESALIPHDAFRNDDWNHYRIVAKGPRIQTYVNGRQISDLVDEKIYQDHQEGFIGLQVHSINAPEKSLKVAWRNIRIRETDTEGWVSLFNGKDLNEWTPKFFNYELGDNPGNIFRVENGVLKVSYDQFNEFGDRYGHLFYKKAFSNYQLRLEYRFVGEQAKGGAKWAYRNNGIMIHGQSPESMKVDQKFPNSIEVQLLGADKGQQRTTGNICTPGTKFYQDGKLREKHCYTSHSLSYEGEQWVQAEIHVFGSQEIIHLINGKEVFQYQLPQLDDGTLLEGGSISLQAESHDTEFRNIEIKVLE